MLAKVLSWCGSRLGGSAPMTASRTPPLRGVSAAGATPGRAISIEATRHVTTAARTTRYHPIPAGILISPWDEGHSYSERAANPQMRWADATKDERYLSTRARC